MITVIPMNDDRIANHFSKANYLVFFDERGIEINRIDNSALVANCVGKKKMVDQLTEQKADRIIVRNIGERMLGKLLARQFAVYQTNCGRYSAQDLVNQVTSDLVQLHQANQGRQSRNHEMKKKSSYCFHP
ncbi:NifB/NifX family molybdenum-iron cluster-binding protein [Proteus mirabilis]|uniref:NifB/NifX family molybdenum-iron cluster-binding protein n=1 Tax=Morganellaceae TaxID=1903414 RepID=UPI0018CFCC50|nr:MULTISPECIES: NifB/NifX family molybdenum-iron cluster-binding protein [Morganellaceae]EKV4237901.1 dinitrogenase iron-molybdenum cofactor [Morganella morganii]ELL8929999.1 dinitrogenase iron-molybdenum cofactor [Morganella morganii]QPN91596.1 dinitrogenase iron-molybdenum cofactor [Proteus vulgaris]